MYKHVYIYISLYIYPQAAWFAVSVNVYVGFFGRVVGVLGGLIRFTQLRFCCAIQGGHATLQVSSQGGHATLQVSFQGGYATLQVSFQGGNAKLQVSFQGGHATL